MEEIYNSLRTIYKYSADQLRDKCHITGLDTVSIFNSLFSIVFIVNNDKDQFKEFNKQLLNCKKRIHDFNDRKYFIDNYIKRFLKVNDEMEKIINYKYFLSEETKDCTNEVIIIIILKIIDFIKKYESYDIFNDLDIYGCIYEIISKDIGNSKIFGQYFTPINITNLTIKELDPEPDKFIYDPCLGSGGFIISYLNYIKKYGEDKYIKSLDKIYGCEILEKTHNLACANLSIKTNHCLKHLYCANSLNDEIYYKSYCMKNNVQFSDYTDIYPEKMFNKFDYIVTNPPYGVKGINYKDVDTDYCPIESKNAITLFIQMIIKCLKIGGKAAVVIPVGQEMNSITRKESINLRQLLLRTCKINKIIYLEPNTFENTGVETCIMIFEKVKDFKDVIVESYKKLNKIISIGNDKYLNNINNDIINDEILYYINDSEYKVSKKEIEDNKYVLDYRNYIKDDSIIDGIEY